MNTILLIIQREYLTRVKKKSFIIMTLLAPILMSALFIIPAWIATSSTESMKFITVIDKTGKYSESFNDTEEYKFLWRPNSELNTEKENFSDTKNTAVLFIPATGVTSGVTIFSDEHTGVGLKGFISKALANEAQKNKLKELGITQEQIASSQVFVPIKTVKWTDSGEKTDSAELMMIVGFISAIIIYMFIFMYGAQVMRGVIEEKTSRVVEVIISSVKPFQLMAGKILGIALVALTQFLLWGILTGALIFILKNVVGIEAEGGFTDKLPPGMVDAFFSFNWQPLLFSIVFFFIAGYLLYAALFAAIGSAADNETDTQQFMLPVTIPLILAFAAASSIMEQPGGDIAFWFSVIPFTSPIVMPLRVAADAYQMWELALSIVLLIGTIAGTIWFAAKIYRVGILMYGKKVSYKELWKWIKYK